MKVGYFGKLPSYGDFIQRNVSPEIIKNLDNWFLQSIENSRAQIGSEWQQLYFNSPIWRFVISQNTVCDKVLSGFMMPSVDKAGRCYPFSVICELDAQVNPFIVARQLDANHKQVEEFVLSLLEKQKPNLDEIQQVLDDLYSSCRDSSYYGMAHYPPCSYAEIGSIIDNDLNDLSRCNDTFLQSLLTMQKVKITLWWTSGGVGLTPRKRYFSDLPPVETFSSFLRGTEET
ncbi:type VI secretion system-associated protein TagF [Colwellia sp. KU-HH00111]|uniref:type VI secretion system-associated protein TagF n=1 Tax=Colwellia sp. KU-HH00111 TaxID=3127652 RepID=UPI0031097EEE